MSVVSRKHKKDLAQVFTNIREVEDMLDQVSLSDGTIDPRTTVLDPSTGFGIFAKEVLARKIAWGYNNDFSDINGNDFFTQCLMSTYAVDIDPYSTEVAREIVHRKVIFEYSFLHKGITYEKIWELKSLIEKNIITGDFVKMKDAKGEPLMEQFVDWEKANIVKGDTNENQAGG